MNVLETTDLVAGYGRLPVLHGVSIQVPERGASAIIGPNGAGKSTLMKTLARQIPVMSGDIEIRGRSYRGRDAVWAARNGIAYVPQTGNVFPDLSVEENLRLGAFARSDARAAIQEARDRFPVLAERAPQSAGSLSGGERQILAISCALLMRPSLLLLDEPTTGLSPKATRMVVDWIGEIIAGGTAVLWVVEQQPKPVLERAEVAYMLEAGQVRFAGEAGPLLEEGRLEELFLRRS